MCQSQQISVIASKTGLIFLYEHAKLALNSLNKTLAEEIEKEKDFETSLINTLTRKSQR